MNPAGRIVADEIRSYLVVKGAPDGWLNKSIGVNAPDASTLWAAVPFNVFDAEEEVMTHTLDRIRESLEAPNGGVHRYSTDSYYGGGLWVLLTAYLGEVMLARGDWAAAGEVLQWIEAQSSPDGDLPEQIPSDLNETSMYEPWKERWGPIASPLLWSHAAYLRLERAYSQQDRGPATEA